MTFDPGSPDGAHALDRLRTELIVWFTSVTPDGQPQSFPVWFLWDDGEILVYSHRTAKRNDNVEANPRVSLHLNDDGTGADVVVIEGEARFDPGVLPIPDNAPYLAKYASRLETMTAEQMWDAYNVGIRVRPTRIRAFRG